MNPPDRFEPFHRREKVPFERLAPLLDRFSFAETARLCGRSQAILRRWRAAGELPRYYLDNAAHCIDAEIATLQSIKRSISR